MDIEKFEVFAFTGKPLNEHELGDELVKLLEVRQALEVAAFNDKVLDLTERLLWTRQEVKYRARQADIDTKVDLIAAATEQHAIEPGRTDADGHSPCSCGHWWDSPDGPSWDEHMAEVAMAALAAATVARRLKEK